MKIEDATWMSSGDVPISNWWKNSNQNRWLWIKNSNIIGNGDFSVTAADYWDRGYYDGSRIEKFRQGVHYIPPTIMRNSYFYDIWEDMFKNQFGLVVNTEVELHDRREWDGMIKAPKFHPAVFSLGASYEYRNVIFYNFTANKDVVAATLSGDGMHDSAFVDVNTNAGGRKAVYIGAPMSNMLFEDTTMIGGGSFKSERANPGIIESFVIRNSRLNYQQDVPPGFERHDVRVYNE